MVYTKNGVAVTRGADLREENFEEKAAGCWRQRGVAASKKLLIFQLPPKSCLVYKSIVDLVMATFGSSNYSGVGRKEDGLEILFYEGLVTLSQNPQQDPGDLIGTTL